MSAIDFQTRAIRARTRRATARVDPWFGVLVIAMLVTFAAFFAIGRLTAEERPFEGPPSLQAASRSAVGAIRLSGVPPIAISAGPKAVSVASTSNAGKAASSASAQEPLTRELSHASLLATSVSQPKPAVPPAAEPVASAPVTPTRSAPAPATAPSRSHESTSGNARGAQPSSGADGTFDSSG